MTVRTPAFERIFQVVLFGLLLGALAGLALDRWGAGSVTGVWVATTKLAIETAEQRPREAALFLPLEPGQQLHEGALVRTGRDSAADLELRNGVLLRLGALSMLRLNVTDREPRFFLEEGRLVVESGSGSHEPLILDSRGGQVRLDSGSVGIVRSGRELTVRVFEGRAEFEGTTGTRRTLHSGEQLVARTGEMPFVVQGVKTFVPEEGERVVGVGKRIPVRLQAPGAESIVLGRHPSLHGAPRHALSQGILTILLAPGNYYWRAHGQQKDTSTVRSFLVVSVGRTVGLFPAAGARLRFVNRPPEVHFAWDAGPGAQDHRLEVARDAAFRHIVHSVDATSTRLSLRMQSGSYHWRVVTRNPLLSAPIASDPATLEIVRVAQSANSVPKPRILQPAPGSAVDMATQSELVLRWSEMPEADQYEVELRQMAPETRRVFSGMVGRPRLVIRDLSLLDEGTFEIVVRGMAGSGRGEAARANFRIFLSARPGAPRQKR